MSDDVVIDIMDEHKGNALALSRFAGRGLLGCLLNTIMK